MAKRDYSFTQSLLICLVVYVIALVGALITIRLAEGWFFKQYFALGPLWVALLADVVATIIVFIFSVIFKNASLYDPYWSVAPPLIAWYWMDKVDSHAPPVWLMLVVITFWAIRLTLNWIRGWKGLAHEDWRYVMLHDKNPSLYWLTNFGGIHMFPTIMVFLGMLPVYFYCLWIFWPGLVPNQIYIPLLIWMGAFISLGAAIIELIADEQMRVFKKTAKAGEYITTGIWKYSRHPNYFGEISFWFGLWVMMMGVAPDCWWTGIGFVAMLALFLFASVPMMEEKNLKNKPGYGDYVKRVSVLIPWFPKK
jgi:steroid 5-alpha reductase family enzyme